MKHWILTESIMQSTITNLDRNLMKLKAAKTYYAAYGVTVAGKTKEQFIKNLVKQVRD